MVHHPRKVQAAALLVVIVNMISKRRVQDILATATVEDKTTMVWMPVVI